VLVAECIRIPAILLLFSLETKHELQGGEPVSNYYVHRLEGMVRPAITVIKADRGV
jgi:hypothetical protein